MHAQQVFDKMPWRLCFVLMCLYPSKFPFFPIDKHIIYAISELFFFWILSLIYFFSVGMSTQDQCEWCLIGGDWEPLGYRGKQEVEYWSGQGQEIRGGWMPFLPDKKKKEQRKVGKRKKEKWKKEKPNFGKCHDKFVQIKPPQSVLTHQVSYPTWCLAIWLTRNYFWNLET